MSHRNNFWHEQLTEHLERREWSEEDKAHFLHMVGHSALMSEQGVLSVLEFQQATDERIEAEKQYDKLYYPADSEGEALEPGFVQRRFLRGE